MSNSIKSFITAKIGSPMSLCDDHYAYNLENLRFAISDGASCNLASRIYSRLLVDNFASDGRNLFSDNVCISMRNDWREETRKNIQHLGNPYYLVNLFNNPVDGRAQATFVGLEFYQNEKAELVWKSYVIGDSVLIFVPKGTKKPQLLFTTNKKDKDESYTNSIVFDNSPLTAHPYDETSWTKLIWESFEHKVEEGTFLMMTDALAEWFISSPHDCIENKFTKLAEINSQEEFEEFVKEERSRKLEDNTSPLHDDDVTLIVLNLNNIENIQERGTFETIFSRNYRHKIELDSKDDLYSRMLEEVSNQKKKNEILTKENNEIKVKFQKKNEEYETLSKEHTGNKKEWEKKEKELNATIIQQGNQIEKLQQAKEQSATSKTPIDLPEPITDKNNTEEDKSDDEDVDTTKENVVGKTMDSKDIDDSYSQVSTVSSLDDKKKRSSNI